MQVCSLDSVSCQAHKGMPHPGMLRPAAPCEPQRLKCERQLTCTALLRLSLEGEGFLLPRLNMVPIFLKDFSRPLGPPLPLACRARPLPASGPFMRSLSPASMPTSPGRVAQSKGSSDQRLPSSWLQTAIRGATPSQAQKALNQAGSLHVGELGS